MSGGAWRFMHPGSACIMIEFRSDHACIMHKSETDWMHARGQPASARAWQEGALTECTWMRCSAQKTDCRIGIRRPRAYHIFSSRAKDAPTPSICAKIPGWIVLSG